MKIFIAAAAMLFADVQGIRDRAGSVLAYSPAHAQLLEVASGLAVGRPQLSGTLGAGSGCSGQMCIDLPSFRYAATRIEQDLLSIRNGSHLGALASLRVLSGKASAAVPLLEEAVALEPRDARLWNDLAASRLLSHNKHATPPDLIGALVAADRSGRLSPALGEARVNLALALDQLVLKYAARQAWCQALPSAPNSEWTAFMADHCTFNALSEDAPVLRKDSIRLGAVLLAGDDAPLERSVAVDRQAARELAMSDLLLAWSDAVLSGRNSDAAAFLAKLGKIGQTLVDLGHDFTVLEMAQVFEALPSTTRQDAARAARNYVEGRRLYRDANVEAAATHLRAAASQLEKLSSPLALWAQLWLGGVGFHRNEYQSAIRKLSLLLTQPGIDRYPNLIAYGQWLLGACYLRTGRFAIGLEWYDRAAQQLEMTREERGLGGIYSLISEALDFLGKNQEAWEMRYRALRLLQNFPNSVELQNLLREASREVEAAGDLGAARWLQGESLQVARRTGRHELICYTLLQRSRLFNLLGLSSKSIVDLRSAKIQSELVEGVTLRKRLTIDVAAVAGELDTSIAPRERDAHLSAAINYYTVHQLDLELAPMLLARAQLRLAVGAASLAEADLLMGINLFERHRAEIDDGNFRFSILQTATHLFDQMIRLQVEARQNPALAFAFAERGRTVLAGFPQRANATTKSTMELRARTYADLLSEISSSLSKRANDTVLIEYAVLPSALFIWRVQADGYHFIRVPGETEGLRDLASRFLTLVRSGASARELETLSTDLYRRLIEPVDQDLPADTNLVIVPDKFLNALPFAALQEAPTGRFLIESHSSALCPQAALLVNERARTKGGRMALVVGKPTFDLKSFPRLGPLPGAFEEAVAVGSLYSQSVLLLGVEATRARFLAALEKASVVHFAGHALVGGGGAIATQLVLASTSIPGDKETVSGRDLLGRRFPALRLVVLSACSTIAPDATRSGGLFGLARPFLEGGVDSVLGTLWRLDDDTASAVLPSFHQYSRRGFSAAASLRLALLPFVRTPNGAPLPPAKWASLCLVERGLAVK